jgi:hypothetical protein
MGHDLGRLTMDTVLVPNPTFVLRVEQDEGGILYDAGTGAVRLMNLSATLFWSAIDGRRALADVIAAAKASFEEVDAEADAQLVDIAHRLYEMGAVGVRGGGDRA